VLVPHGGADTLVPVPDSVAAYAAGPVGGEHGIAVFPGADHGPFTADPDPTVPRTSQLAPGALAMVVGFLRAAPATV
jgi:hypothetical protein